METAEAELTKPEYPTFRRFKLFTGGKEPGIDAIAIICEVLKELEPNELSAAMFYVADKHGYRIESKRS